MDTPEQHKKDVDDYLIDSGFYESYPDVNLSSASYNASRREYTCVFDVPDDLDITMEMVRINGVPVLNVINNENNTRTPLIDTRLHDKIGPNVTDVRLMEKKRRFRFFGWPSVAGTVATGVGATMVIAGAGTSWCPVGWVIGGAGLVVVGGDAFYTFIIVHRRDTSAIPNLAEIEEAIRRGNQIAEEEVYDLNDLE